MDIMVFLFVFYFSLCCCDLTNGAELRPPNITTLSPKSIHLTLQKNTVLTLDCTATGEEPLEYRWEHNGKAVTLYKSDRVSSFQGKMVIIDLRPDDQGNYRCVVSNRLGIAFGRDVVVKFSYVSDFLVKDTDQNIQTVYSQIGSPLQIDCPEFGQSSFDWGRWGGLNKDGSLFTIPLSERIMVSSSGSLVFAWLKQNDADMIEAKGGISCIIETDIYGTDRRISHKHKINTTGIASTTEIKPEIVEGLLPVNKIVRGERIILRCTVTGRPTPSISWLKDGDVVIEDGRTLIREKDRVLWLRNVTEEMSGQYECIARNTKKTGIIMEASSKTTVIVGSKPAWKTKQKISVIEAFMSKDYKFNWEASGNPTPLYTWYKNGKKLDTSLSKYKVDDHTLKVTGLTSKDKGIYQCTAENEHGKVVAVVYLNVVALAPTFEEVSFGPFKIYLRRKAVLSCNPQAAPAPNKTQKIWEKNRESIVYNDTKYDQTDQGDLIIFNVDYSDQANYTCNVMNEAGRAQATAIAIVSEPPTVKSMGLSRHEFVLLNYLISFLFVLIILCA